MYPNVNRSKVKETKNEIRQKKADIFHPIIMEVESGCFQY